MKNWITTIIGFAAGIYPLLTAIQSAYEAGYFTGKTGTDFWLGLGFIVLGFYAKDKRNSGTDDPNKLDELADKVAQRIGGTNPPPIKDEK
jgi:hypothetical protein